ncbi:MAG TPA: oligopeptidase A, partial [Woeseiaceae bacterium]|nr:oligopeptidase A [Woeseiaceae bacterium]
MSNPLLDCQALPRFAEIRPEHALPALTETIAEHRRRLARLLDDPEARDFESFVVPLEEMHHELARIWSPVGHLHAVLEDPAWREAYNDCLPLLTEHGTELAQNKALQQVFEDLSRSLPPGAPEAQRTLVEKALRDFRLGGVALPESEKAAFREAMQELAAVQAKFEQNLQDATDSWSFRTDDEALLRGLPEQTVERARADAARRGESGWRLSLDYPTWQAVITHADARELR